MVANSRNMTVGQVLQKCPEAEPILRKLCVSGEPDLTLARVALKRGWPEDILTTVLGDDQVQPSDVEGHEAVVSHMHGRAIQYIQDHYHGPLQNELQKVESLLVKALNTRVGTLHDRLSQIRETFVALGRQMLSHVSIEEDLLFPYMRSGRRLRTKGSDDGETIAEKALHEMDREHELLKSCLGDIRRLTRNYHPEPDDHDVLIALYSELRRFDQKLEQHAAVEHDFLWPATETFLETSPADPLPLDHTSGERTCPRTGRPCDEGHPSTCTRFWHCLQTAIDARWNADAKASGPTGHDTREGDGS
jgi:iron-sulfur cluster repair protein YtfE (RIC family)